MSSPKASSSSSKRSADESESKKESKKLKTDDWDKGVIKTVEHKPIPFGITEPKHNSFLYATLQAVCACEEIYSELQKMKRSGKLTNNTVPINMSLQLLYLSFVAVSWDFTPFELVRLRVAQSDSKCETFKEDKEHDSYEFFRDFEESARKELNTKKDKLKTTASTVEEAWNNLLESDNSFYTRLFCGIQETETKSCKCNVPTVPKVFKHFRILKPSLSENSKTKTIQNVLKKLEEAEQQKRCEKCDSHPKKYTKIVKMPEILVIRLPPNLPKDFVVETSVEHNKEMLDLFATIQHKSEPQTKVYTALRKYNHQWFLCEPQSVRKADDELRRQIRDNTQMDLAFYRNTSSQSPLKYNSIFMERNVPLFNKTVQKVRASEATQSTIAEITDRLYLQLHVLRNSFVANAFVHAGNLSGQKPMCVKARPYDYPREPKYSSVHNVYLQNMLFISGTKDRETFIHIESKVRGGVHYFINQSGHLSMLMSSYEHLGEVGVGQMVRFRLQCSNVQYMSTVYPNRALTIGTPQLAIGLQLTSDGKTGRRIARQGNVESAIFELRVPELTTYRDLPKETVGNHFAIYVGKGAKMAVIDPIDIKDDKGEHTRTLLNEGSVFIGNCDLYCAFATNFGVTHNKESFRKLLSLEVQSYFDDITNPVLFLAQNRAGFQLELKAKTSGSSEYQAILMIPEEGSFETITDWDTGMAAIVNLVCVDCLYKNTVYCKNFEKLPTVTKDQKQIKEWKKKQIVLRWMPGFKRYSDSVVNLIVRDTKKVLTLPPDPKSKYSSTQTFHESDTKWYY